jgi:hypothetical protein
MKKSDGWWDGFFYGNLVGIFAGIAVGFLMWS